MTINYTHIDTELAEREWIKELSDKDIGVMVNDADYCNGLDIRLYGEAEQDWLTFEEKVRAEQANRIIVRDMLKGGNE